MRSRLAALLLSCAAIVGGQQPAIPQEGGPVLPAHVPGELLVGFAGSASTEAKSALHRARGAALLRRFDEIGVDLVRLPPGLSVVAAQGEYSGRSSVRFTQPNYLLTSFGVTPNDPQFGQQWALRNTGQTVEGVMGIPDSDIDASEEADPDAWDTNTGTTGPIVAVIDTGIDIAHPDLAANIWSNPGEVSNGFDDDGNGYVDDLNGWDFAADDNSVYDPDQICLDGSRNDDHGTHIAGILGAVGNNGIGVSGVNWRVSIMPLKFVTRSLGVCGVGTEADAIEAILYATRMGAHFINVSWGRSQPPGSPPPEALRQAFIAARQKGILFAAAAGNESSDLAVFPTYPASFDLENEIVVAASDNRDELAFFSNYGGPTDVAAPGVGIRSTITENGYASKTGTSMAAPFVTGALALLKSQYPGARSLELKSRIVSTVDAKSSFDSPITQSGGRLNLSSALRRPVAATGYSLVARDGGIFTFGRAPFFGSTGGIRLNQPIVGMAPSPWENGYWLVASDGGIFTFGGAAFFGSTGGMRLNQPIVGMAPTPLGNGYWLVATDGGIFTFGDAGFFGSTGGIRLNQPIVGMAPTPSGNGYWLVATDGGIFTFGDAGFFGSTGGIRLNQPIVGMAPTPSGNGYWLVATDGGIFTFGDAGFFGSTGSFPLNQPIVGMASSPSGNGYWLVAADGGIFTFADAPFFGSTGGISLNQPIVGMAAFLAP